MKILQQQAVAVATVNVNNLAVVRNVHVSHVAVVLVMIKCYSTRSILKQLEELEIIMYK